MRDNGDVGTGPRRVRGALVALLLLGAFLAIQPWLACASPLGQILPDAARICTFGSGNQHFDEASGFSPMWWRLMLATMFVVAAGWLAFTRRLRWD